MKNGKRMIYLRYEFSNESGKPEGGDIFEYVSTRDAIAMMSKALKVAHGDGVAVHFTVGEEKPFFGFLKAGGLSRKYAESEMVAPRRAPAQAKKRASK